MKVALGVFGETTAPVSSTNSSQQILRRQQSIHRSRTETLQIEGDELEAQRFENCGELRGHGGIKRPLQLFAGNFNAYDLPVVAHAELPEAQRAKLIFALFDHSERLSRD